MIYKLRTSSATQEIFAKIGQQNGLQPFILAKIAIALSIKDGNLSESDFNTDTEGLELNRQTIFGDTELIFRSLVSNLEQRQLPDEEFFPKIVKAHLDRGAKLLDNESKYGRNFYTNLCQLDTNI